MKINERISYEGKEVFVGIDVHRSTYFVTYRCEGETAKRCQLEASAKKFVEFLNRHFRGASISTKVY